MDQSTSPPDLSLRELRVMRWGTYLVSRGPCSADGLIQNLFVRREVLALLARTTFSEIEWSSNILIDL